MGQQRVGSAPQQPRPARRPTSAPGRPGSASTGHPPVGSKPARIGERPVAGNEPRRGCGPAERRRRVRADRRARCALLDGPRSTCRSPPAAGSGPPSRTSGSRERARSGAPARGCTDAAASIRPTAVPPAARSPFRVRSQERAVSATERAVTEAPAGRRSGSPLYRSAAAAGRRSGHEQAAHRRVDASRRPGAGSRPRRPRRRDDRHRPARAPSARPERRGTRRCARRCARAAAAGPRRSAACRANDERRVARAGAEHRVR